ncbi:MAG: chitobiase/beta-hexosaminidase C-terminal domain-containing protein [Candidatus Azobacteroides sp.]|nr:chitobiase/beta-hexosaminidase C-terminal domain-containing protein [Candidatus Azobacteroides sp.]
MTTGKNDFSNLPEGDDVQRLLQLTHDELVKMIEDPFLNLEINGKGFIEVIAEPKDAAAGKTIIARSISSVLATVTGSAVLDADGKAILQVAGELPGSTQIVITLDGTDVKTTTDVYIAMALAVPEQQQEQVEIPVASIPSGSTVIKNTEVSLSSATEGADIYYTTDGSDPSGSAGIEYTRPIVLTEDVTIRAIAVKEGMTDSEIAVFEYTIDIDIETNIDQPDRTAILFVRNQTLVIRGLKPGESYTVYSVLGTVVTQGIVTDQVEQQIFLPYKGIFVVSTPIVKAKVPVE